MALGVVLAAGNYPDVYAKGQIISVQVCQQMKVLILKSFMREQHKLLTMSSRMADEFYEPVLWVIRF
jgi:phosphoribosylamine-glycine ligase